MTRMSARQAFEWVHAQTIAEELVFEELVAAFTALTGRTPHASDRPDGLFRRLREIVMTDPVGAVPVGATSGTFGRRL